ncbi:MAG: SulP family inorganic anion transporter [Proteobacteria bacterium]|nr:SulP family inorganic anion transporter [Pseudomonadota bacterium]
MLVLGRDHRRRRGRLLAREIRPVRRRVLRSGRGRHGRDVRRRPAEGDGPVTAAGARGRAFAAGEPAARDGAHQVAAREPSAGGWPPIRRWLPAYRRAWLAPDILAGLAVWAVMVPEGMAYAGILGVPPIMGLYTLAPPLLAYAVLGTSRLLVVGPDTATGLISALTVGALAAQGSAQFDALTSTLAVMIGAFFLLFGLLRMGWVAAFIPAPVMRGFIEGLVLVTIIGQVPHLLGIEGASGNFFDKLAAVLRALPQAHAVPALTGLLCLAAMLALRRISRGVPAALIVAVGATAAVALLGGAAAGIEVVGPLPSGLPHLTLPVLDLPTLRGLAPGALAIVLVGYAEALGGAQAAAGGETIDPNAELVAHGPANILSGLFGGFLVVGSLSKTSVAMAAHARSQVANLVAAALCFLTLILLTPLFRGMPHPALAAIVIAAMLHLSKPGYLRDVLARSPGEFAVALVVIAGELALGVLQGIALGVGVALLMLIYRASHPRSAVLGRLPGTEAYRDIRRRPGAETYPGLLIWRPAGEMFFASIGRMDEELRAALAAQIPPARYVLVDAEAIDFIDITASDALLGMVRRLRGAGIGIGFARLRDEVRERMRAGGVEAAVGAENFFERVTDGVTAWERGLRRD